MSSKVRVGNRRRAGLWALVLLVPAMQCAAQRLQGSFGASSDYVLRGLSQTLGDPAAQAAFSVSGSSGWYAGVWASALVDPDTRHRYEVARYEIDLFAGYRNAISEDWLLDISVIRYSHPDDARRIGYDYTELVASLSFTERASLSVAISPDTSMYTSRGLIEDDTAVAVEASLIQPIFDRLSLTGGLGYSHLGGQLSTGYSYWNAGVALEVGRIAVDLTHIETDQRGRDLFGDDAAGARTVLSLIVAFSF